MATDYNDITVKHENETPKCCFESIGRRKNLHDISDDFSLMQLRDYKGDPSCHQGSKESKQRTKSFTYVRDFVLYAIGLIFWTTVTGSNTIMLATKDNL